MDVDAEVEGIVIPVGMVVAAPLALAIEAIDIAIDLPAITAVAIGVAVDAFLIVLNAAVTFVAPVVVVVIGAGRAAQGERESDGESGDENEPQMMFGHRFGHGVPPLPWEYERGERANRMEPLFGSQALL